MRIIAAAALLSAACWAADLPPAVEKPRPPKSGFFDFFSPSSEFGAGIGTIPNTCTVCVASQPSVYAGNFLLDCDGELPHNETSITVNPNDKNHVVGAYHSYQLTFLRGNVKAHIVSSTSVSFDGGQEWQQVTPPITPYQFIGDPAVAFNTRGRVYLASIGDHEGPGGSFTGPSVVVLTSNDGARTWSNPVTVARGQNADNKGNSPIVFQDKEFIAVDTGATSPFRDRAYVTWTSFQEKFQGNAPFFRSPITLSLSDDGLNWSDGREISGFSPVCSAALFGAPFECDLNQYSSPSPAPGGRIYVGFENFNTPAENQYLVVSSGDGGSTWTAPTKAGAIFDINLPQGSGRSILTGCQFRVASPGNTASDPSDATGRTVYAVWADNRNGSTTATNLDIVLARSSDGGATWVQSLVDSTANDQFYPWVAVAGDGRVDVGYMDRAYSSGQSVCQYGFSLTRLTFDKVTGLPTSSVKTRVDSGLSDPGHSRWFGGLTNGNATFIGDYNGIAVGSDGTTYSLWTDQRNVIPGFPANRNHGQHAVGARTP